jgi:hypothetical protein
MTSIAKRAAGLGAAVALIAAVGPIGAAGAATLPAPAPVVSPAVSPLVSGAYQAGLNAAVGGWNAGADAAIGGWNAGASALGLPFSFSGQTVGPLGLHTAGLTPLYPMP